MDLFNRSVDELTAAELSAHYIELQSRSAAVLVRMWSGAVSTSDQPAHDDQPLDADAIAAAIGQSRRWVFRHAKDLPFVVRTGRKGVVGSRAGLQRWLKARRA